MNSESVYAKLPLWIQEVAINLVGWGVQRRRYGVAYEAAEKEVFRRGRLSSCELRAWQTAQLSQHLRVGSTEPFWIERFNECGINPDGDPWGEYAKLPISNWLNPGFPLFRYEVGDVATLAEPHQMPDGTQRYVEEIDGRMENYVILDDGTAIGRLGHILKDFVEIREAQIFQRKKGEIEFRVVKGEGYSPAVESRLLKSSRKRLGDDMVISIRHFDYLERTEAN